MAPYIDSMDGPVVKAAENALDMENIKYILPYVSPADEGELKDAFEKTLSVRELSGEAAELADYWFLKRQSVCIIKEKRNHTLDLKQQVLIGALSSPRSTRPLKPKT